MPVKRSGRRRNLPVRPRGEPTCVACRVGDNCPEAKGCYEGTRPGKAGSTLFTVGRKDRVRMSDYRCWESNTGLLAHTGFQSER